MVAIDPLAIEQGAQIQTINNTLRGFYRKPTPRLPTLYRPSFRHILFFCCCNCSCRELTQACDVTLPTPIGHTIYILPMSYSTIS